MEPADVPAGPLAVDTDVFSFIHWRRGDRRAEFEQLIAGRPLVLPFPVVGELTAGALRGHLGQARREELRHAIEACVVIPSDARIVDEWSNIYARFLDRLKGGGVNDMWAAACCRVYGLPIVTNNIADFGKIAEEFPLTIVHPDL